MSENKFINALGIVAVFGIILLIIKMINNKTETKLYSDKAYKDLQDKQKLSQLNDVVAEYHKSGKWSNTELK
jgi:hypothetical protein